MSALSKLGVKHADGKVWICLKGKLAEFSMPDAVEDIKKMVRGKKIDVVLQERFAITKVLSFPFSGHRRIYEGIKFELMSELPGKLDDYLYSFCVIERSKFQTKVLVIAVRKDIVEEELVFWENFGAKPISVTFDFVNVIFRIVSDCRDVNIPALIIGSNYIAGFKGREIFFHRPFLLSEVVKGLSFTKEISLGSRRVERVFALGGIKGYNDVERIGDVLWEFSIVREMNLLQSASWAVTKEVKVALLLGLMVIFVLLADQVLWLYHNRTRYEALKLSIKKEYVSTFGSLGANDPLYNARQRLRSLEGGYAGYRLMDALYLLARSIGGYNIEVDEIDWDGKRLRFSAYGKGFSAVKLVQNRLKKQKEFEEIVVRSVKQSADKKRVRFVMDVVLKR